MPNAGELALLNNLTGKSYGSALKDSVRRYYGCIITFAGLGEMVPNDQSFCELDPNVKDQWGIPVLRFYWKWSEHELRQVAHMKRTFSSLAETMGGKVNSGTTKYGYAGIRPGGNVKHEVGGTVMGSDPHKSVTNQYGQTWDVKNLFVTDGGTFCSNADKNPTLTIMALAWRSADYLLSKLSRREL